MQTVRLFYDGGGLRDLPRFLARSRPTLRRRTADRYSAAGKNERVSRALSLVRGKISPLDHVGPEDLRIKELLDRIDKENFAEIIFALAADVEGEATTNYLVDLLKGKPMTLTRIARGLPAGGGLESADELTLSAALSGRTKL